MVHLFYKDKDIIFAANNRGNIENNIIFAPTLTVEEVLRLADYYDSVYISSDDPEAAFGVFTSRFKEVEAAGGVVLSDDDEVLMIKRNGRWDLPKGKREPGEEIAVCAVREVQEECGVGTLECGELRCVTSHIYQLNKEWVVKPTYWYNMRSRGAKQPLTPQIEEGIELVEWVRKEDIPLKIKDSYSTIKYVFK